jgi:hypothetical protein
VDEKSSKKKKKKKKKNDEDDEFEDDDFEVIYLENHIKVMKISNNCFFFGSKMDCENLEPVKGLVKKPTKLNEALLKAKPLFNPGK